MAYSGQTTHYGLPKYVSTDKPSWLDTNDAFDTIDAAIYAASTAVDPTDITNLQNDVIALQANKQDVLTFDAAPTSGSINPVTSGGVYDALGTKEDTLTFDAAPTSASLNPVTSGGVYTAVSGKLNTPTLIKDGDGTTSVSLSSVGDLTDYSEIHIGIYYNISEAPGFNLYFDLGTIETTMLNVTRHMRSGFNDGTYNYMFDAEIDDIAHTINITCTSTATVSAMHVSVFGI